MYRALFLLAVVASALAWRQRSPDEPASMVRSPRDRENMAKTFHLLRELDDFYSKLSRPRQAPAGVISVQRRDSAPINKAQYLQLLAIDRQYSHRSRPRFGKRVPVPSRSAAYYEDEGERMNSLFRRR